MILLYPSHVLTPDQMGQIEVHTGEKIEGAVEISTRIRPSAAIAAVGVPMANAAGIGLKKWQTTLQFVSPPALKIRVAGLVAERHPGVDHFQPCIRTPPVVHALRRSVVP